jgi:ubiquinone/menaquinone biosynthesis C-methylase UbiE
MTVQLDIAGAETRAIHDLIDFTGKNVLEVGCGDGRLTWRYADSVASVLALDSDVDAIARARDCLPERLRARITFRAADITEVDLPAAAFDVAVLSWSLC